jgi:hypothetical protein
MSENERELTAEERERRRQEHNEAVTHGGVTQIGDFDREVQEENRQEDEEEAKRGAFLNANDPALPTVKEEDLGETDEEDRDTGEVEEQQGDHPGEN